MHAGLEGHDEVTRPPTFARPTMHFGTMWMQPARSSTIPVNSPPAGTVDPAARPRKDATTQEGYRPMYIAMNRFRIVPGNEAAFETVWRTRDSHLKAVPGFREFHLLRGPTRDDHTLYASHSVWESRQHFEAWTKSEAFRAAHRNAGGTKPLYLGPPEFEGFDMVLEEKAAA